MLVTLEGLDHVVAMVGDLDAAAQQWRDLGFTVSPRGTHSAQLGTGNYTIMFDDDYIELLGVVTETEHNSSSRAFLSRRGDGLERAAFRTSDAAVGADALKQREMLGWGPIDFSRPLELPGGGTAKAAFSIFRWPDDESPGDLRIFACQHHTRDTVWIPELMNHANTACGINQIQIIAQDPQAAASHLARLIEGVSQPDDDGFRVETGPGFAHFMFMTKKSFVTRHHIAENAPLPDNGAAALVLRARNLDAAARCAGPHAVRASGRVTVPAEQASGVMVVFEPA